MKHNYTPRCNRYMQWVLIIALIGLFNLQGMAQSYSGGSGTSSDPYQISTLNDLKYLSENISEWSKHFVQTAEIDATETSNWNNGDGFSPIGDMRIAKISFTGSYNGGGNEIVNLTINRVRTVSDSSNDFTGLFGDISGPVSNLGLRNTSITSNGLYTGAIAGYMRENSNGSIINCYATGAVYGNEYTGGITGLNAGNIHNTFFIGDVNSSGYRRGGIAGAAKNRNSNISNCYAIAPWYSGTSVGPILGLSIEYAPDVNNCFYSSSVYSSGSNRYGAKPLTTTEFTDESNFTNWDFMIDWKIGTITDLATTAYPYLTYQYPRYDINFTVLDEDGEAAEKVGLYNSVGIKIGETDAIGKISIYTPNGSYAVSLQTEYLESGDILFEVNNASVDKVVQLGSKGLTPPADAYDGGDGSSSSPYQIATLAQLRKLSERTSDWTSSARYFVLTANIDAKETKDWNFGEGFSPIGNLSKKFGARIDGQGYIISNLHINRPNEDNQGLFGYTNTSSSRIENVHLVDVNITGKSCVGGLVGYNYFTSVSKCSVSGQIGGSNYVGGLIGYCQYNQTIEYCYSNVNIIRGSQAGGLIGYADGRSGTNSVDVKNSFAFGSVSGSSYLGGLIGYQTYSSISNSYAAVNVQGSNYKGGLVGYKSNSNTSVTSSYYDKDVSGMSDTGKGEGLATTDFADASNFTNWDLENTWVIETLPQFDADNAYPYLQWMFGYTINFEPNGGLGSMETINNVTIPVALPQNSFTKEGYTFQGWSTIADGDVVYENEETVAVNTDLTLYAVWEQITYTLSFYSNGGEGSMDDIADIVGDYVLPTNNFTKVGYTFMGWSTSADGDVVYENEETVDVDADLTLYAVWDISNGVGSTDAGQVSIYPNPAHDYVFIAGDFTDEASIQIYSVSGTPMAKYPLMDSINKISIADLNQGVYMLRIKNGSQQIIQKLIVK